MEYSLVSKNNTYTLQQYDSKYSKEHMKNKENKIKLNYFTNLLSSTYAELFNHIACKKCIEEFDNICYFWYFSCDIWDSYYDFEFREIKSLMNTLDFLKILKVYLTHQ